MLHRASRGRAGVPLMALRGNRPRGRRRRRVRHQRQNAGLQADHHRRGRHHHGLNSKVRTPLTVHRPSRPARRTPASRTHRTKAGVKKNSQRGLKARKEPQASAAVTPGAQMRRAAWPRPSGRRVVGTSLMPPRPVSAERTTISLANSIPFVAAARTQPCGHGVPLACRSGSRARGPVEEQAAKERTTPGCRGSGAAEIMAPAGDAPREAVAHHQVRGRHAGPPTRGAVHQAVEGRAVARRRRLPTKASARLFHATGGRAAPIGPLAHGQHHAGALGRPSPPGSRSDLPSPATTTSPFDNRGSCYATRWALPMQVAMSPPR